MGKKASIHMRYSAVSDGTLLCFGDYRVFMFLHVLRYTMDVSCNWECFP